MTKIPPLFKKHNFNFAWTVDQGQMLKQMVVDGMARHGFKDAAEYVRYCIKETSLRETGR